MLRLCKKTAPGAEITTRMSPTVDQARWVTEEKVHPACKQDVPDTTVELSTPPKVFTSRADSSRPAYRRRLLAQGSEHASSVTATVTAGQSLSSGQVGADSILQRGFRSRMHSTHVSFGGRRTAFVMRCFHSGTNMQIFMADKKWIGRVGRGGGRGGVCACGM